MRGLKKQMKNIRILFMCSLIIMGMSLFQSTAVKAEVNDDMEVEYFDDGSFMVTKLESAEFVEEGAVTAQSTYTTVRNSKSTTYYNALGTAQWKFTITGTFQYNGTTSSAISASSSVTIYKSQWSVNNRNAYTSGSSVKGSISCSRKNAGIVTLTKSKSLTLTCSKNGVFS